MEIDLQLAAPDDLHGLFEQLAGAEVCIAGAGIAGLVLATALARHGLTVTVLEAGGRRPAALDGPDAAMQGLGGTSGVWGGQLLPMGEGDAWPVPDEEISEQSGQVESWLGVDDLPYEAAAFFAALRQPETSLGWLAGMDGLVPRLSKFAPFHRRNLSRPLGRDLMDHPRVTVVLGAAVNGLVLQEGERRVSSVRVRVPSGAEVRLKTKRLVLAAGTVETCRLLLVSVVAKSALPIGRNFHDHLTLPAATLEGRAREMMLRIARPWIVGGLRGTTHALKLEADATLRRRLDLNPVLAHLTIEEPEGSGVEAVRLALRRRQGAEVRGPALAGALARASGEAWRLFREASREGRRYVSPRAKVQLRLNAAQRTPGSSAIVLTGNRDRDGQMEATVERRLCAEDDQTFLRFGRHLVAEFERKGLGATAGMLWQSCLLENGVSGESLPGLDNARHAMGGACMGASPASGVVDAELRVQGVENLWLASAAVFPDGRAQLPTLTLMALCLRLADCIARGTRR